MKINFRVAYAIFPNRDGYILVINFKQDKQMRKVVLFAAACALLAACGNGKTAGNAEGVDSLDSVAVDSAVYTGVTPAADCFGIRYRLALAQDSTNGFSLSEEYLKSENEVDTAFAYSGTAKVMENQDKSGKTYYVLRTGKGNEAYNFLQLNDSTLRMVNADLEEAVTGAENYDLKLQK